MLGQLLFEFAFADLARGVSGDDGPGGDVLERAGACADYCTFAHGHARRDEDVRAQPYPIADDDLCAGERHARVAIVVAGSTEESVLADGDVASDDDWRDAVDVDEFAEGAGLAEGKIPGCPDSRRGRGMRVPPNRRAEHPQQHPPPDVKHPRTRTV